LAGIRSTFSKNSLANIVFYEYDEPLKEIYTNKSNKVRHKKTDNNKKLVSRGQEADLQAKGASASVCFRFVLFLVFYLFIFFVCSPLPLLIFPFWSVIFLICAPSKFLGDLLFFTNTRSHYYHNWSRNEKWSFLMKFL